MRLKGLAPPRGSMNQIDLSSGNEGKNTDNKSNSQDQSSYNKKKRYHRNERRNKNEKNTTNMKKQKINIGINKEFWGHTLSRNEEWPDINHTGRIRIVSQNVNGVSYFNKYNEWEILLDVMHYYQADIFGICEMNLDLNQPGVNYELLKRLKKIDRNAIMSTSSSIKTTTDTPFKMGGTSTTVRGNISGRIVKKGSDKLQRWSYVLMKGKGNKHLKIITTYRTGINKGNADNCTIRTQQERDLMHEYGEIKDPREQLLIDLTKEIQKDHNNGTNVIVMGDMNEDIESGKRINLFLQEAGLKNIHKCIHKGKLPHSYDKGNKCLDIMAMTGSLPTNAIKEAGIMPFYHGMPSDHRAFFIDIDPIYVFTNIHTDPTRNIYKRFSTSNAKNTDKYLKQLENDIEDARVTNKIDDLERDIKQLISHNKGSREKIIKRCKTLFNKVTQMMISSDKKVGRIHYPDGFPMSPTLKRSAEKVINIKSKLRKSSIKSKNDEKQIIKLRENLKHAYKQLRDTQKKSAELRKEFLQDLAKKKSKEWNVTASQAVVIIEAAEEAKELHKKHRYYIKPRGEANIKSLLVPAPVSNWIPSPDDITNEKCQTQIDDPTTIFDVLLRQNFRHLLKSQHSEFTKGKLGKQIGTYAENEIVEELLQGIDQTRLSNELSDGSQIMENFIKAMKRPISKITDNPITNFNWTYGVEEYKKTFSKTSENTACGPSGLHMSHWKAALEREVLMRIHSFFIWAAFAIGFSYDRWEISQHCMLKKKSLPFSQKLRIIQLFEGDFNGALKYILGRKMMQYITKHGIVDKETYGSRIGKTAIEAIVTLQCIMDNTRIWKKNMGLLFNDADGCYDRIPANLAEIALRRLGCPKSVAQAHTVTQRRIKHYIKTGYGTSNGYIMFDEAIKFIRSQSGLATIIIALLGPIGGTGQGGGASPIIWLAILLIMMEAYRKTNNGIKITDRISKIEILFWILSYVDDNSILRGFQQNEQVSEMLSQMRKSLLEWNTLLKYTGGDLSLGKCVLTLMHWKTNYWGLARLSSKKNKPGTITVPSESQGQLDKLKRIEPWEAERILGVRLPADGNMNAEYKFRKKQADNLGLKLFNAPFSPYDAWTVYQSRYKAMIGYSLPVTTFTRNQLDQIQKKFIFFLLPKLGMNRHTPRAIVYGPMKYGGRNLLDLRIEQPTQHLRHTLGHMRRQDNTGKLLTITKRDTQLESGLSIPFYKTNPDEYNYVTKNTRWRYLWQVIYKYDIDIHFYNEWIPTKNYDNDKNIMETAVKDPKYKKQKTKWKLEIINNCRMYIGAIFLSDMVGLTGRINKNYLNGNLNNQPSLEYNYPAIRKPTKAAWNEWKEFIHRNFLHGAYLVNPPLSGKISQIPYQQNKTEITELMKLPSNEKLSILVQSLPTNLKKILGTVTIPKDDGEFISSYHEFGPLIGASDGSLMDNNNKLRGGYAYSLQRYDSDKGRIKGYAPSPTSSTMSSFTTELYGQIAILLVIYLLEKSNNSQSLDDRPILIYIDNKEVVKKTNKMSNPTNISETLSHEYDIKQLSWEIRQQLKTEIKMKWIKGHQNRLKDNKEIYGPFTRATQLNIEMDDLATKGVPHPTSNILYRPIYSTTIFGIYTKDGIFTDNFYTYLNHHINGPIAQSYITNKYGWTMEQQKTINWDDLGKALSREKEYRKTKIVQLIYNWQHDGQQQQYFEIGDGKCPTGCGENEEHGHYLYCQHHIMRSKRQDLLLLLKKKLLKINTYPGIISTILHSLKYGVKSSIEHLLKANNGSDKHIHLALKNQFELGHDSLAKGFMSTHWKYAQGWYENDTDEWSIKIIAFIQDYTYSVWKIRNEFVHGTNICESRQAKRSRLCQRVKEIYAMNRGQLSLSDKKIFKVPLSLRIKSGITSLEIWIDMASKILQKNGTHKQTTLHSWIEQAQLTNNNVKLRHENDNSGTTSTNK